MLFQFACWLHNRYFVLLQAGLSQLHVRTISGNIHIYLIYEGQTICLGALSSVRPKIQLDVMMSGNFQLYHSGSRKTVYFNACEFKPRALYKDTLFRTNKKLWGMYPLFSCHCSSLFYSTI